MPDKLKRISEDECIKLCDVLSKLRVICLEREGNTHAPVLGDSLVTDPGDTLTPEEQQAVICNWIEIEDDPIIQEAEIEEAVANLEKMDIREAQSVVEVESESEHGSDDDEDKAVSITTPHDAEAVIGDLISYCKRRKFNDAIGLLEKA
jgi:hypothetical protein